MNQKLQDHIQEYGGKHGSLLYFREHVEGGAKHILPFEILAQDEQFGLATRRRVWAACKEYGTEKVIVRTSDASDWGGMVDAMPTIVTNQSFFGVRSMVNKIRERCHDPRIIEYARKEGSGYDPNRVTVSVGPYLDPTHHPRTLVTEHPNNPNACMVDVSTPYELHDNWFRHRSFDFDRRGRLLYDYMGSSGEYEARSGLSLARWLEESGQLPDTEAFQFEGALFQSSGRLSGPKLFQIRHFAEKRLADFQIPQTDRDNANLVRNFGVTPPDGVRLNVARVEHRSGFSLFEERNPQTPYLLSVHKTTDGLNLTDQPTSMKGYFCDFKPALSHQATRLVQMALRDPHGVASTIDLSGGRNFKPDSEVRVLSDGVRQRIEGI